MSEGEVELVKKRYAYLAAFLCVLILGVLVFIGFETRTQYTHKNMAINTVSFFYSRAHHLFVHGEYLKYDSMCYAPLVVPENYPPGLAYTAVWSYSLSRWLHHLTFYEYIINFPIIMYVVILLTGFMIMSNLYSRTSGLIFAALLTILPLANKLTYRCYFTTEAVGIWFYLMTIYFLVKLEAKPLPYSLLAILSLTGLMITWQLFMPMLIVIVLLALFRIRRPLVCLNYLGVIFASFVLGYIVCRWFVGIAYSPYYAIKELVLGMKISDTPDYALVLGSERKIRPMDMAVYLEGFSWITIPLLIAGIARSIKQVRAAKYFVPLVGVLIGIILVMKYIKFRFIALPFILIVSGIGGDVIAGLDLSRVWSWGRSVANRIYSKSWFNPKTMIVFAGFIIVIGLVAFDLFLHVGHNKGKKPKVKDSGAVTSVSGTVIGRDASKYRPQLTRSVIKESLALGKKFLVNNQLADGSFTYEYDFIASKRSLVGSQVRKAGALWALALIHRYQPSSETAQAVRLGLQFYDDNSVITDDGRKCIHYPGEESGQTGTVAMVVLTLVDYLTADQSPFDREKYLEDLKGYVKFLVSLRSADGRFYSGYQYTDNYAFGEPSPYYDGEALLALTKAAKYMAYEDLLSDIKQSAERMYEVYVVDALKKDSDSPLTKGFYHWGSMAYYEMFTAGWEGTQDYPRRVIDMAYWMIDVHKTLSKEGNTGYAYEGIISAWELARLIQDKPAMEKLGKVVDKGIHKLTTWQVHSPIANSYLGSHPTADALAVGGVMNSEDDPVLRIDVTQHQMHAVIMALESLYK